MKPEFHDEYQNPHVDPLAPQQSDFDWDSIYRSLGEDPDWQDDDLNEKLLQLLKCIFEFCLDIDINKKNAPELIGRRFIALAWVTNPALFNNSPSLTQLSKSIGLSPYPLAVLTGEVSRKFRIQNRAQAHAWNRGGKGQDSSSVEALQSSASGLSSRE